MANNRAQTIGVVVPLASPRNPSPDTGRSTAATTSQPMAANTSADCAKLHRLPVTAHAAPRAPRPTIMATMRPNSSTTLPACCRLSIRKPKAKQGSWADAEARQNRSRIVVRRLLEAEPVDATAGPRRDHSPEWSPDGRRVAFVSRRGPVDQIFVLDMTSPGDARQLTSLPEGAGSPLWSRDGTQIAFMGTVLG